MYYQNKRQKVDHHLQGGIHNNNPRELTQVSDQSKRVDKPNNAKINNKNKPSDRRYEIHPGKETDRQSDGRRLQGWSTVSGNARCPPAEPSRAARSAAAAQPPLRHRSPRGATPGCRGGSGARSRRPPSAHPRPCKV